MDYINKLKDLIKKYNGVISTKIVSEAGIPRSYLSEFIKRGIIKRLERGIYISKNCADDEMYRFQMKYGQAIFSHDSALFLYEFLDEKPQVHKVTVKTGVNTKNLVNSGAKVYSIKKDLYSLGITTIKTRHGHTVKVYNIERTICDLIRSRSQIEHGIIIEALKKYNNSPNKNFVNLIKYAEQFRVAKILTSYLEFL